MYTQKTKIYIKRHRCHNNIVPHCPLSSICIPLTTPYFFCRTNTPHTQTTPYMISQSLYVGMLFEFSILLSLCHFISIDSNRIIRVYRICMRVLCTYIWFFFVRVCVQGKILY